MYARTISRKNKNGTTTRYLQLANKYRDPISGIPKDEVICHLGREDQIDKNKIKSLIKSLSRFLDPHDQTTVNAELQTSISDLKLTKSLPYGGSYLLDAIWRQLELDKTLSNLLSHRKFEIDIERLIFAMVANRALSPSSKLKIERWVGKQVFIPGLEEVSVHQLYRAMDFLIEHQEIIQRTVYFSVATLLNLEVDLLFFDTTSTYFEIDGEDMEALTTDADKVEMKKGFRCKGHSKDHRPDAPQIVIGLAVTRDGIPVRCWVFPGNTADAKLIKEVQSDMAGWQLNRLVWVVDRGFSGHAQRIALQRGGNHVIMGEKMRSGTFLTEEALKRPGRYHEIRENLRVKEVTVTEGSESRRFVIVHNPKEAERDRRKRESLLSELKAELESVNSKLGHQTKRHANHVLRLKSAEKYRGYVVEKESGKLEIDAEKAKSEERLDGKYLLSCTDNSLRVEDIALGYKQLKEVEHDFHLMKHTLDLRPIYHELEDRIRCHVLLCWLGLLLIRVIEESSNETWDRIRDELSELTLGYLRNKDGEIILRSDISIFQNRLFKSLKVKLPNQVLYLESH